MGIGCGVGGIGDIGEIGGFGVPLVHVSPMIMIVAVAVPLAPPQHSPICIQKCVFGLMSNDNGICFFFAFINDAHLDISLLRKRLQV